MVAQLISGDEVPGAEVPVHRGVDCLPNGGQRRSAAIRATYIMRPVDTISLSDLGLPPSPRTNMVCAFASARYSGSVLGGSFAASAACSRGRWIGASPAPSSSSFITSSADFADTT